MKKTSIFIVAARKDNRYRHLSAYVLKDGEPNHIWPNNKGDEADFNSCGMSLTPNNKDNKDIKFCFLVPVEDWKRKLKDKLHMAAVRQKIEGEIAVYELDGFHSSPLFTITNNPA